MTPPQLPPRDGIVRARPEALELRSNDDETGLPTMVGHFAVFNEFTEINSLYEGHFLERISPGAFKKTIKEQRNDVKVLFQHGHDPHIADKPLGKITALEEDEQGVRYEVEMLDTSYNRDLLPALEAGLYGASFRFRVLREEFDKEPERSDHNPEGIPERTVQELQLYEFGPVTFPAYSSATAGVRSMTDEMELAYRMAENPERVQRLLNLANGEEPEADGAAEEHSDAPRSAEVTHAEHEGRTQIIQPSSEEFWSSLREKPDWEF